MNNMQRQPNTQNKANVAQASVLESNLASALGGSLNFAFYPLPFSFSPNEPICRKCYKRELLDTIIQFTNRIYVLKSKK